MREETRRKIARARRGKKHSPETRAKISAALKGRAKAPEHRDAIAAARRERPTGPEAVLARAQATGARRKNRWRLMRKKAHNRDLMAAQRLGDRELWEDIDRSWGWRSKRKIFRHYEPGSAPRVSCGFSAVRGEVLWDPAEPFCPGKRTKMNYALVDSDRWLDV